MIRRLLETLTLVVAVEGCDSNQPDSVKNYNNKSITQNKSEQEEEQTDEVRAKKIALKAFELRTKVYNRVLGKDSGEKLKKEELQEINNEYSNLVQHALKTKSTRDDKELVFTGDSLERYYNSEESYKGYINPLKETQKLLDKKTIDNKIDNPKEPSDLEYFKRLEIETFYKTNADGSISYRPGASTWEHFKKYIGETMESDLPAEEKNLRCKGKLESLVNSVEQIEGKNDRVNKAKKIAEHFISKTKKD